VWKDGKLCVNYMHGYYSLALTPAGLLPHAYYTRTQQLLKSLVACQPPPKSGGFVVLLCRSVMKAEVQHER
jgi:hypothetical protein